MTTLQKSLLDWYDKNKRPLPWRKQNPNPYHVWLSEIMLQQTQVETVLPYYKRFLNVFPTVHSLSKATINKVLRYWSGLGYYSRARNLHRASQIIMERGSFPKTKEEWLKLPGIGPYTASAIASIAFGERVPVVDGNVIRVLTRLFALRGNPKKNPLKRKLWEFAASLTPPKNPGNFNQALMELGALVCLPKSPKCPICPVQSLCKAFGLKKVEAFPTSGRKIEIRKVSLEASLIQKNGSFLLAKRNDQRHLQSMWEFPQVKPRHLGVQVGKERILPIVRHSIMNRSIRLRPYLYPFRGGRPKQNGRYVAYRWIKPKELQKFPTSSLNHKMLRALC